MLRHTKIRTKLILVLSLLSIALVAIGIQGIYSMRHANEIFRSVYDDRLVPSGQLARINDLMQENIRQLQLASMHDPRFEESKLHTHPITLHTDRVEENIKTITEIWKIYMTTYLTPAEKTLAEEYREKRGYFVREGLIRTIELIKAGKIADANMHLIKTTIPAFTAAKSIAENLLQLQLDIAQAEHLQSEADFRFNLILTISLILAGLLLAWGTGFIVIRTLGTSLTHANHVANSIAAGDLTSRIEISYHDEIGELLGSMNHMQGSLISVVSRISRSADTIAAASSEIASGNQDLSSRTEQQASSLEETASSMEEITSTVRQNGDNARQANQLATQAAEVATRGGEAAQLVATTMDDIAASSNKIVDIISVIDGIAFQTNILALNAAVEAARAGEQGRGFAVVATEVRSLAQRSATAAREIKDLIDDSVSKVSAGTGLVNNAVATMLEIGESIRRVNDIMNEITMATQEQVQGIEQVNQAVTEMDTVSQQNAALVEEAAAAAESLQDQARALVDVVSMFNTDTESSLSRRSLAASMTDRKKMAARPAVMSASAGHLAAPASASAPATLIAHDDSEDWEEI